MAAAGGGVHVAPGAAFALGTSAATAGAGGGTAWVATAILLLVPLPVLGGAAAAAAVGGTTGTEQATAVSLLPVPAVRLGQPQLQLTATLLLEPPAVRLGQPQLQLTAYGAGDSDTTTGLPTKRAHMYRNAAGVWVRRNCAWCVPNTVLGVSSRDGQPTPADSDRPNTLCSCALPCPLLCRACARASTAAVGLARPANACCCRPACRCQWNQAACPFRPAHGCCASKCHIITLNNGGQTSRYLAPPAGTAATREVQAEAARRVW